MRAPELMIGDLVYNSKHEKCKVYGISNIFDSNITLDNYDRENDGCFETEFEVDPIPINKENLEKIGFKGDGYAILILDDQSWLEYYYHEHRLRKYWKGVDEWQNHSVVTDITFQCHCYYIHELQHALRLCGIKKEIIL